MSQTILEDKNNSEGFKISSIWKRIYDQVLEGEKDSFPSNFWNENAEEKTIQLLKYYTLKNNIQERFISYRDPEELVRKARLKHPVQEFFSGIASLLVVQTFDQVCLDDFRWNNSREPMPKEVGKFRKHYSTWKEIGNYYGRSGKRIRKLAQKENLDLSDPQENSFISAPVLEVELFWHLIDRIRNNTYTLEKLLKTMKNEAGWKESSINKYLCRYKIKDEIDRRNTHKRQKIPIQQYGGSLNETEKLVVRKLGTEGLKRLKSHGADFLKDRKIIEVKKHLRSQNIHKAINQLNYADDTLLDVADKQIYTRSLLLEGSNLSDARRLIKFYNIEIFVYNAEKGKFSRKDI